MSTCRKEGKDVIIFATAEDHKEPSTVVLPEPEEPAGLILPNGEINWNCPCLGGMATGPCGVEFRQAFTCFHNSDADPKGSDCFDAFKEMHLCMAEYPQLYNRFNDDEEEVEINDIDIKLSDAEKALISEDNINLPTSDKEKDKKDVKVSSDKEKFSSKPKVEEKSVEKKGVVPSEPKKASTPSSALQINA